MRRYQKMSSVGQTGRMNCGRSIHRHTVYILSEWVSNSQFIPSASVEDIVRLVYWRVIPFCGFGLGLMMSINAY
jgi:hypothetical protein